MVLVAPPSRRPPLRQGERLPCGPTYQQASVEPPGGTRERPPGARGRGNSRGKQPRPQAQFPQGPLPKGGVKRLWRSPSRRGAALQVAPPDRWWN
ncbi:MAG TPA: hypothetical protein VH599_13965 [Ktedonobacterales bacterium]